MREIKFRVWDIENKKFEVFDFWGWFAIGSTYWENQWAKKENLEVMQFTGLKDSQGIEIYEGDIMQPITMNDGNLEYWTMFDGGVAIPKRVIVDLDKHYPAFNVPIPLNDFEIIGNIYENPNLMEKEKENGL